MKKSIHLLIPRFRDSLKTIDAFRHKLTHLGDVRKPMLFHTLFFSSKPKKNGLSIVIEFLPFVIYF